MFTVLHANHLEDLRDLALKVIKAAPQPPLVPETFLVQSNGMAQWLRLSLAEADGIAASVDFPLPSSFVWRAYRGVLGGVLGDEIPELSPFDKGPLAWRLLRLLPGLLADESQAECYAPLRDYLCRDERGQLIEAVGEDALPALPEGPEAERQQWQLACQLADLFDQYLNYRPEWVRSWESGLEDDNFRDAFARQQAASELPANLLPDNLPDSQQWQPALWRAVLADAPSSSRQHHRAALHGRFVAAARALETLPSTRRHPLPPRLFVFGISALPGQTLDALHALSGVMDIYLMITNPCRHYWGDIVSDREAVRRSSRADSQRMDSERLAQQRARHPEAPALIGLAEEELHLKANPLLAGLGAQGRDFIVSLYEFESALSGRDSGFDLELDVFVPRISEDTPPEQAPLLQQIQDEILELVHPGERALAEGSPRALAADDDSISLVSAHSALREVEILHDRLLAAFERAHDAEKRGEGEPLRPRDILVMVPDIDRYAPYIEAVFGQLPPGNPRHIPFTIADRVASQANPLLGLVLMLLELPERRLGVSEVLDALDVAAFRRRFAIEEGELERLRRWLADSGVRWGLSGEHREQLGFMPLDENSWRFGLERMLLGYATGAPAAGSPVAGRPAQGGVGDEQSADLMDDLMDGLVDMNGLSFDGVVPFDEVAGLEAELAGKVGELIESLDRWRRWLDTSRTPADWATTLQRLWEESLSPDSAEEFDILARLQAALSRLDKGWQQAGFEGCLSLKVVREALRGELDSGGLAQRFLAGRVNFATLMPMRAIPFREVHLLGMNDGDYPRVRMPQDFDLMASRPQAGDRSRRDDDRYLFLEALLAARDRLSISWVGRDQRDNGERPPSVLVGELLDYIELGWEPEQSSQPHSAKRSREAALRERLITEHPLQPFSRRYFHASQAAVVDLFSYDASWSSLYRAAGQAQVTETLQENPSNASQVKAAATTALRQLVEQAPESHLRLGADSLARFLRRPWQLGLDRVGVRFRDAEVPDEDNEPFAPDGLENFTLTRELLDAALAGQSLPLAAERLRRAGRLPALGFADALIEPRLKRLDQQLASWRDQLSDAISLPPRTLEVPLIMQDEGGEMLRVTLTTRLISRQQLRDDAEGESRLLATLEATHFGTLKPGKEGRYKKLGKPHRLLAGYLDWLMANARPGLGEVAGDQGASREGYQWLAVFEDRWLLFPALRIEQAEAALRHLVKAYAQGWQAPLAAALELATTLWEVVGEEDRNALFGALKAQAADGSANLETALAAIHKPWLADSLTRAMETRFSEDIFKGPQALRRQEGALGELWPEFEAFAQAGGVLNSVQLYQPLIESMIGVRQGILGERAVELATGKATS
ncbi:MULTISPECIES: exodeoxyribonuclease V subunit gamma [Cobetia]|uniref:exodeoxyribonuclease V subunit gamma n=1 Tax=Cobetia TaxID=204286 RepID=UPI00069507C1|nr:MULTISPECIES: exodeoxyribonuclease V subunit gamma [Cobetia]MBR9798233.1 exodeoxyribonuclease V subunit gamma [Gammaproteobacteria bacterium]BBO55176.1 RecBCD enzyme subunit RecC [Cobetia sp. AM6]